MKNNQLRNGAIVTYLSIGLNIFLTLTYTPLMLKLIGQSEYGLYNTVSSAILTLSLLNCGFNSGYIKYYSKYKFENDLQKINKLNGLFLIIFTIIGMVALICGLVLSHNLNLLFNNGLTFSEYKTAKVLAILLTVNLALSFPMSVFSNIISAHECFVFLKIVAMIKAVLAPLLTIPLLFMGFKSIAIATVTVICSLIADGIYVYYVLVKLNTKFTFSDFEKGIFKGIFGYTFFIALNMLIDQINWNIDKLLLTRYKGTAEVAVYSLAYTISVCYNMFSTSISSVFIPRVHKLINKTKDNNIQQRSVLTEMFTRIGRIQFLIIALISSGFIFFGRSFIVNFWADSKYENTYWVTLLLILPSSIALIQNIGIEIQRAQNKHKFRSYVYLLMAVINLFISVYLCQIYGAVGSAIGTTIALVIANGLIMNIYYHKKCNIDILFFWKNILRMSVGLIPSIIAGVILIKIFDLSSIGQFLVAMVIYVGVYVLSVWIFSMNNYEKKLIYNILKKLKK